MKLSTKVCQKFFNLGGPYVIGKHFVKVMMMSVLLDWPVQAWNCQVTQNGPHQSFSHPLKYLTFQRSLNVKLGMLPTPMKLCKKKVNRYLLNLQQQIVDITNVADALFHTCPQFIYWINIIFRGLVSQCTGQWAIIDLICQKAKSIFQFAMDILKKNSLRFVRRINSRQRGAVKKITSDNS
jgi:hypothetical protein